MRHRWQGWSDEGALRFETPAGERLLTPAATVLALGGGSWAKLGSDGRWWPLLQARGVDVTALKARPTAASTLAPAAGANICAAVLPACRSRPSAADFSDAGGQQHHRRGECLVTATGIEGSLIYALAAPLRDTIEAKGEALLHIDLMPDWSAERVTTEVCRPRGARSLASHLQSRLRLKGLKAALLRELLSPATLNDPTMLAAGIKALPLRLTATRPLDEAISSAGGVRFEAMDEHLMLRALPGVFCAGEMLDWEAPTGGYLLTACFASGHAAACGALDWLQHT
jgi:uncharacterized flavoprotein (TIGR03862 family)